MPKLLVAMVYIESKELLEGDFVMLRHLYFILFYFFGLDFLHEEGAIRTEA